METREFFFDVPPHLIAQAPPAERGSSRLLVLDRRSGAVEHRAFGEIASLIPDGSVLVFNDSRVRKARLPASSDTGASVELLLIEPVDPAHPLEWKALVGKSKRQKPGRRYTLPGGLGAVLAGEAGPCRIVRFTAPVDDAYLDAYGHVPLPPYIKRADTDADATRYQTVYAGAVGSAAAPTAGLHFTETILEQIAAAGVEIVRVTLHVGIGTFLPMRTETVEAHRMHEERYEVPIEAADAVNRAIREARPVIAVGTTSVRTLEAAAAAGNGGSGEGPPGNNASPPLVSAGAGATELFIYPGYRFRVVSGMITNFHTPGSSLIVMVSAFAGIEHIRHSYLVAVAEEYRFFSYGDAMFIR